MATICSETLVALRWPVQVEFQTKLELLGEKKKDYLKKSFVLINHSRGEDFWWLQGTLYFLLTLQMMAIYESYRSCVSACTFVCNSRKVVVYTKTSFKSLPVVFWLLVLFTPVSTRNTVYFIHLLTLAIWDNKKWLELQLSVKMEQNSRSKIKASQLYCTVKMTLFFSLMF